MGHAAVWRNTSSWRGAFPRMTPVTLECRVLYTQNQALERMPEEVKNLYCSQSSDTGVFHTAYIGQIVDAYVVE